MSDKKIYRRKKLPIKMFGLLVGLFLVVWMSTGAVYAGDDDNGKLKNGSFEEGQNPLSWSQNYNTQAQGAVSDWNTTATDGKIELLRDNTGTYIPSVTVTPTDGGVAAELNANEESTLYQNVNTAPSSIYEWGLDHGARNGTDTMALVIGPGQEINPSKPDINGRDQLMQMVDWLILQGKTSIKTEPGLGEQLIVYSKKFGEAGTFQDNSDNNAFSLTPSSVYTEEWHIWIIADSKVTSGTNPWGSYGSNAEADNTAGSGGAEMDLSKYYLYTVPSGQTKTMFGFVSVGCVNPATTGNAKTYGNFLDNINFEIYHPLSGSSTLHGSGVVGGSDGSASGEGGLSSGYEVTVDNNLITYAVDGVPLKVQAIVKCSDADEGCEFVGLYYTKQDEAGNLVTNFLQKAGNEIEYRDDLTESEKQGKWIKSTNSEGDTIFSYYLENITSATDLHFVFIKSPTVTYDPNGGKPYTVERTYNTEEAANVYSYKPVVNGENYTFISPYVSHAAEGQNENWKFMGWLLTGDTVDSIPEGTAQINKDQLGTLLLPGVHTIACDYSGEATKKEQYFKIWNGSIPLAGENVSDVTGVKWVPTTPEEDTVIAYANIHKGITMVAQWRWRQAFIPQINRDDEYIASSLGGTVEITGVTPSDENYDAEYNANGGKAYFAKTDEIVTIKATANEGYEFEGWYDVNGNLLSTRATYSYTETKEKVNTFYARFTGSVTQKFIRQVKNGEVWIDIDAEDNSIATLDRYIYTDTVGNRISSTATVKEGYEFVGWFTETGVEVTDDKLSNGGKTLSYTTTGDATYYARFQRIASANMNQTFIRQLWNGNGWTNLDEGNTANDNIATLSSYSQSDSVGETVSSKATANTGYKFEGWYDALGNKVADNKLSDNGTTLI
ncbi:MAG: InlB B-repeat-containing protein, partial [Wujia sp.]